MMFVRWLKSTPHSRRSKVGRGRLPGVDYGVVTSNPSFVEDTEEIYEVKSDNTCPTGSYLIQLKEGTSIDAFLDAFKDVTFVKGMAPDANGVRSYMVAPVSWEDHGLLYFKLVDDPRIASISFNTLKLPEA